MSLFGSSRWIVLLGCGLAGLALVVGIQAMSPNQDRAKSAEQLVGAQADPSNKMPAASPPATKGDSLSRLSNDEMSVEIDPATGHILAIDDLTKTEPVRLVDARLRNVTAVAPFYVTDLATASNVCQPTYPPEITRCDSASSPCRLIRWSCGDNSTFEGRIELAAGRPAVRFFATMHNGGSGRVAGLTYPVLGPLAPLSDDPENDTLAIPYEGGMLIRNPIARAREENGETLQVLGNLRYPYGHGAMLQMISYQSPGRGGFLIYTPDAKFTVKRFGLSDAFPQAPKPWVMAVVEHRNWDVDDIEHHGGMALDYPVEIAALPSGDWHEAAEIYRQWGEQQEWAQDPIAERAPQDRRLFETAAVSVFGLSARENQTAWYRAFHDSICDGIADARVLFVPGWDFHPNAETAGQPINAFYQAGWDKKYWLPYQGEFPANYQVMKGEHDDFVYPFLFDMLVHDQVPGWDGFDQPAKPNGEAGASWSELQVFDANGEPGGYYDQMPTFPGYVHTLNPANATVREFHHWRSALLRDSEQDGVHVRTDGAYYDISTTIAALENYGDNNDQPYRGAGRWMVEAAREMYAPGVGRRAPRENSTGMENVSEPFVDEVDFYHLGAEGLGPIRPRTAGTPDQPEFDGVHRWVMNGEAINIPLFSFVYHPYGALRTGGKIQISEEMGDIFYWITASEYLWGGILELIYFNTPVDLLPGVAGDGAACPDGYPCAYETGWSSADISPRGWHYDDVHQADPAKIAFLRQAARLRLEVAPDLLTSGRMLIPPRLDQENESFEYDYDFYSCIRGPSCNHFGTFHAPAVLAEAWETWDRSKTAFILANPTAEEQNATLTFDPATYGFDRVRPVLVDSNSVSRRLDMPECEAGASCILYVSLAPHSFYLVNLETPSSAAD